ncbi:MAG: P-loop NTPase fold protein [Chloroflexi bacterium]|nr:P-loop NTPase fold protein [Chloroflexota bacterium]
MRQDDSGDEIRLLYDTPLRDPSNDQLERRAFAEFIAKAICTMDADEGFVFSLQGPWGSGKTTTINFVLDSLGRQSDGAAAVAVY